MFVAYEKCSVLSHIQRLLLHFVVTVFFIKEISVGYLFSSFEKIRKIQMAWIRAFGGNICGLLF